MKIQTPLNRIERELSKIAQCTSPRNPRNAIKPADAFDIAKRCTEICETAAIIAGQARERLGNKGAKKRLVTKVRKALGFIYP